MILGTNGLGLFNSEHLLVTVVIQDCAFLNRRSWRQSRTLVKLVALSDQCVASDSRVRLRTRLSRGLMLAGGRKDLALSALEKNRSVHR